MVLRYGIQSGDNIAPCNMIWVLIEHIIPESKAHNNLNSLLWYSLFRGVFRRILSSRCDFHTFEIRL